jgi:hypothetical protein
MTKHLFPMNTEHVLGSVGLFLLMVVGKLADRGYVRQQTFAGRVTGCMARRAIDAIAVWAGSSTDCPSRPSCRLVL